MKLQRHSSILHGRAKVIEAHICHVPTYNTHYIHIYIYTRTLGVGHFGKQVPKLQTPSLNFKFQASHLNSQQSRPKDPKVIYRRAFQVIRAQIISLRIALVVWPSCDVAFCYALLSLQRLSEQLPQSSIP